MTIMLAISGARVVPRIEKVGHRFREAALTTIAIYSSKGGVGKTSLAVNIAWQSAAAGMRTLLWDLDAQAGATFLLTGGAGKGKARRVLERDMDASTLIVATAQPLLDLLPGDASLRALDAVFLEIDKKKRLRKLLDDVGKGYDRIVLDCPPGLGPVAEQVACGADLVVVPMIPSALSRRAFDDVRAFVAARDGKSPNLLPVFNMVDRRRATHLAAIAEEPEVACVPMASAVEQMAERGTAVAVYAPRSAAGIALTDLAAAIDAAFAPKARARIPRPRELSSRNRRDS